MKVTYNQTIAKFQEFATSHRQVNEFANGDLWEAIQHNKLTDFKYPLLFVMDNNAPIGSKEITLSFSVVVMDKANEGTVENEVKSDTLLILLDLLAYLDKDVTDNWKYVVLQRQGSAEPFTERLDDTLTGWQINIDLKQPLAYDTCQIPN